MTENNIVQLLSKYFFSDESRLVLKEITNILSNKSPKTQDVFCNWLVSYSASANINMLTRDLQEFLNDTGNFDDRTTRFRTETEFFYDISKLERWSKDTHACVILADKSHPIDEWASLWAHMSADPSKYAPICFCVCASEEDINERFRADDGVYYRFFSKHVSVVEPTPAMVTERIIRDLEARPYFMTESFKKGLADYNDVVYPKADLKREAYIDDAISRILRNYMGEGRTDDTLDGCHVPFYKRPVVKRIQLEDFPAVEERPSNEKNILICSISVLPRIVKTNHYYAKIDSIEQGNRLFVFEGKSQLEPGTKYFINRLALEGKKIDKILLHCTPEAANDKKINGRTSVEFYIDRLEDYIKGNEGFVKNGADNEGKQTSYVEIAGLDEEKCAGYIPTTANGRCLYGEITGAGWTPDPAWDEMNGKIEIIEQDADTDNPNLNILTKFYDEIEKLSDDGEYKVNIYLDAQGGQRSFFNMIYSLFSMFEPSTVSIREVCATDFSYDNSVHLVHTVTDEYRIIELVSAVNAFSHYGRGEMLEEYYNGLRRDLGHAERKIINAVKEISQSISVSNPVGFMDGLDHMRDALSGLSESRSILALLKSNIQDKYGALLDMDRPTPLEIISWCNKNKFTQQALAFIEDKMPGYILTTILRIQIDENSFYESESDVNGFIREELGISQNNYTDPANTLLYVSFNDNFINPANKKYVNTFVDNVLKNELMNSEDGRISIGEGPLTQICDDRFLIRRFIDFYIAKGEQISFQKLITAVYMTTPSNPGEQPTSTTLTKKYLYCLENELENVFTGNEENIFLNIDQNVIKAIKNRVHGARKRGAIDGFFNDYKKYMSDARANDARDISSAFASVVKKIISEKPELVVEFFSSSVCEYALKNSAITDKGDMLKIIFKALFAEEIDAGLYGTDLKEKLFDRIYSIAGIKYSIEERMNRYTEERAIQEKNHLEGLMPVSDDNKDSLIDLYCDFRTHEYIREKGKINYWDYEVLCDRSDRADWNRSDGNEELRSVRERTQHDLNFKKTVMGCSTEDIDGRSIIKGTVNGKNLWLTYNTSDREKIDRFLELQSALKKERNNSSHASDSRTRLSTPLIEEMISLYIEMAKELVENASGSPSSEMLP